MAISAKPMILISNIRAFCEEATTTHVYVLGLTQQWNEADSILRPPDLKTNAIPLIHQSPYEIRTDFPTAREMTWPMKIANFCSYNICMKVSSEFILLISVPNNAISKCLTLL